jgi:hypothetical protein
MSKHSDALADLQAQHTTYSLVYSRRAFPNCCPSQQILYHTVSLSIPTFLDPLHDDCIRSHPPQPEGFCGGVFLLFCCSPEALFTYWHAWQCAFSMIRSLLFFYFILGVGARGYTSAHCIVERPAWAVYRYMNKLHYFLSACVATSLVSDVDIWRYGYQRCFCGVEARANSSVCALPRSNNGKLSKLIFLCASHHKARESYKADSKSMVSAYLAYEPPGLVSP